jgi:phosphopantothenoylcysteine decarboxylase/phosphopantothenate--cysteine ligase
MNPTMLANPAVERNLGLLREDGWRVLEPAAGHMACGDDGRGRLPEPAEIAAAVAEALRR